MCNSARATSPVPLKGHFHPKGKSPSRFTLDVLQQAKATLPFDDVCDFQEQKKGFIAPMKELKIMANAGHVAWDMERFQFLHEQEEFDSIHPSLLRQSVLNNNYGLYEVIPGIYQVRGFYLSDPSFVARQDGLDCDRPVGFRETAKAAWNLLQEHAGGASSFGRDLLALGCRPLGGVRGIIDDEEVRRETFPSSLPETSWSTQSRRTFMPAMQ